MKPDIHSHQQLLLEEEVIREAKNDPRAFKSIYEKYFKPIFLFVLHRVGDRDQTADLTAQVFLKALQKIHQFEFRGTPFSSWLFRIAVNECNDFFRRNNHVRMVVLDETHAEVLYEEMFGNEIMNDLKNKLPLILERLSPGDLQYIELRFMEGRPFKEVGELMGVTENYAKVRTYRVLARMRKLFTRR